MFIINAIFWLWLFIVPAGILGVIAFLFYNKSATNLIYSIIIAIIGIISGVLLEEYIRKKYGLDNFFGSLIGNSGDKENNT